MNKYILILVYILAHNYSFAQEANKEIQANLIEKYSIDPYVTYAIDSSDLELVYIPFFSKKGAYFVDYYGKIKNKLVFEDIVLVDGYPFYWGKKDNVYYLYKYPETQVLKRGFERPWAFGLADFIDTYYISPRGHGYECIIFTETNSGNSSNVTKARTLSYHGNFDKDFIVNNQNLFPLILQTEDSLKTVIAINGDKIYDCVNCEISKIYNQKRFIQVKLETSDYKVFDIVKRTFLEGEYSMISRSSRPINMFFALEEDSEQRVSFFNSEGIKTFGTDYVEFSGVKDYIYYITKKDEYQFVNILTGEILATSENPIKQKIVNNRLYILDEKNNYYYDSKNTKLEEITSFVTEETTVVRVQVNETPKIQSRNFILHDGAKYCVARDINGKYGYGWVNPDSSWFIKPKFKSINKFGNDGLYIASQKNGDQVEYGLLKFPEEIIYPFEKRKLSVRHDHPFDLYYLVIEDLNSKIGINTSFQIVYDPNKLFFSDNNLKWEDSNYAIIKNKKKNKIILPYIVYGNYNTAFIFDCKGNFKYKIDENVKNITSNFGFEDKSKYFNVPILPLGEIKDYDSQKTNVLFRLEDGYVFREN